MTKPVILKTSTDKKVVLLPIPSELRINKKLGMFTSGPVEDGNMQSLLTNGRGKVIKGFPVKVHTGLYGKIGKGDPTQWAYVSLLVTSAEDSRIRPGTVVSFSCYRYEQEFFSRLESEATLASIFEEDSIPQLLTIKFSNSIGTQYGSIIKPPSFTTGDPTEDELAYHEVIDTILDKYSNYLPDPLMLYPARYDSQSGELLEGLFALTDNVDEVPVLEGSD